MFQWKLKYINYNNARKEFQDKDIVIVFNKIIRENPQNLTKEVCSIEHQIDRTIKEMPHGTKLKDKNQKT